MDIHSDGDACMVAGLIDGKEQAFAEAYKKYHRHIYFFSLKYLKSGELAEETVHDVFLKVWESRERLNPRLSFKAYLLTICKNHVLNLLKRASRDAAIKAEILRNRPARHEETEYSVHYRDFYRLALRAIAQLPPQRRQVFKMCKLEGKSQDEVARALGVSKGTVRDHLFKGSRQVKEYLAVQADINS